MSEEKASPESMLHSCMDQKVILLTRISDLTKQVEVMSRQKAPDVGSLLNQRQVYLDRLKKCESILENSRCQLPLEMQGQVKLILSGKESAENCTADEAKLLLCGRKCRVLLRDILAMDAECKSRLQAERSRLQKLLQPSGKSVPNGAYTKHFH